MYAIPHVVHLCREEWIRLGLRPQIRFTNNRGNGSSDRNRLLYIQITSVITKLFTNSLLTISLMYD